MNYYQLEKNFFVYDFLTTTKKKKTQLDRKIELINKNIEDHQNNFIENPKKSQFEVHQDKLKQFCDQNKLVIRKGKIKELNDSDSDSDYENDMRIKVNNNFSKNLKNARPTSSFNSNKTISKTTQDHRPMTARDPSQKNDKSSNIQSIYEIDKNFIYQLFKDEQIEFQEKTRLRQYELYAKRYYKIIDIIVNQFIAQENKDLIQKKDQLNWDESLIIFDIVKNDYKFYYQFLVTFLNGEENKQFQSEDEKYQEAKLLKDKSKSISNNNVTLLLNIFDNYKKQNFTDEDEKMLLKLIDQNVYILQHDNIVNVIQNIQQKFQQSESFVREITDNLIGKLIKQNSQESKFLQLPKDLNKLNLCIIKEFFETKMEIKGQNYLDYQQKKRQDVIHQPIFIFQDLCEFKELHPLYQGKIEQEGRYYQSIIHLLISQLCVNYDLHYLCKCQTKNADYYCIYHTRDIETFEKYANDPKEFYRQFENQFNDWLSHDADKYIDQMLNILEKYQRQQFRLNHREYIKLLGSDSRNIILIDDFNKPFLGIRGDNINGESGKNQAGQLLIKLRKDQDFREILLDQIIVQFEEDYLVWSKMQNNDNKKKINIYDNSKSIKNLNIADVKLNKKTINERNMTIKGYCMGLYRYQNTETLNINAKNKFNQEYKIQAEELKLNKAMKKENTEKFLKQGILKNLKISHFNNKLESKSDKELNEGELLRKKSFSQNPETKENKSKKQQIPKLSKEEANDIFRKKISNINDHNIALDTTRDFFNNKFNTEEEFNQDSFSDIAKFQSMLKDSIKMLDNKEDDDENLMNQIQINNNNHNIEANTNKSNVDFFKKQIEKSNSIYEIKSNDDLDDMSAEIESFRLNINRKQIYNKIKMYESKNCKDSKDQKMLIKIRNRHHNLDKNFPKDYTQIGQLRLVKNERTQIEVIQNVDEQVYDQYLEKSKENRLLRENHIEILTNDILDVKEFKK